MIACAGDVPTLEALAATSILRERLPDLKVRFVNVVDLMRLQDETEHPHGLSARDFDTVFTVDKPVIFAYHGYPWLIHRLTYRRTNHENLHVRGYIEEGTTTTPFDMVMMNNLDRFHLVMDVIDRVPSLGSRAAALRQEMGDLRHRARAWTREHGEDLPEVVEWSWADAQPGRGSSPSTTAEPANPADQADGHPSSARTCRAIASSSSVGTTSTSTGLSSVPIRRGPSVSSSLRCGSTSMPSAASPRSASARTRATFSPTPPVKTTASAPPSTARYAPTYLRSRWQ